MESGQAYVFYNVYDRNDNIVYAGSAVKCAQWLGVSKNEFVGKYLRMSEIKGFYITRRDEMLEYEKRRGNKKGYQRIELWFD